KCYSKQLRERLLAQEELDLAKTLRIARSSESAIKEARLLSGYETRDNIINIDRLNKPDKRNRNYNSENFKCYRCGGVGHKPSDCRAISMKCNNCQRLGDFARVCRSKSVSRKPYESQKTSSKKTKAYRHVRVIRRKDSDSNESCIESESEDEQILFMEGQDSPVQITINCRKIKMVADTGCRQNIIASQLYTEQFKEYPLESTTKQFVAYGQKVPLTCLGRFKASLKAEQVNDEIDKMLKDDVIEEVPEPSPWVSNLVVVPKASGGLRVYCDFRELYKAIVREQYVLPKVEDTLDALNGSKYFAKIDARSGFFQLTLSEECRYLTTFITNEGCFRFKYVPFGLSDISETFQKVIEEILFGLKGVEISVDDVIVHAVTIYQLISRLHEVFERCRERNLKLNPKKCEFGLTQIPVLGHVVSAKGIQPDPVKTKAIQETPPPANVAELRSFLRVCGYVSKFIPNYAELVEPLRRLTRQGTN
ncbi:Retrovirus-related Pol poly, partial [Paramuricea clavata]